MSASSGNRDSWNFGHAFREGKLYVFQGNFMKVYRAWGRHMGGWTRVSGTGKWFFQRPSFVISSMERLSRLAPPTQEVCHETVMDEDGNRCDMERPVPLSFAKHRAAAYQAFLATIPDPPRLRVSLFSEENWDLLRLSFHCGQPFLDVLESTPALGFLLASARWFNATLRLSVNVRRVLPRKQREIASLLGFPSSESVLRILRKIPPPVLSIRRMHYLQKALENPDLSKRLRHAPRLNASVLRILCDENLARLVAHSFIEEIGSPSQDDRRGRGAWPVIELARLLERNLIPRHVVLRNLEEAARIHQEIIRDLQRQAQGEMLEKVVFPEPPVPDDPVNGIEAIRTGVELFREGVEMHNCVAAYARDVLRGTHYFYRVKRTGQKRATLGLIKSGGGWRLNELRGVANSRISYGLVRIVMAWLRKHTGETSPTDFDFGPDDLF